MSSEEGVVTDIILLALLLAATMFCSLSKAALEAISKARVFYLMSAGVRAAHKVNGLLEQKGSVLSALLLARTIFKMSVAVLLTVMALPVMGEWLGPLLAIVAATLLTLLIGEMLPRMIAIHFPETSSLFVARPLALLVWLLLPVVRMLQAPVRLFLRIFGIDISKHAPLSGTEVPRNAAEPHQNDGAVEKQDRDMLGSILDLNNREIGEVMVHRTHVYAIDISLEPEEIIKRAINTVHSRIPLFKDNPDNIIGVLHVKDVLKLVTSQKIGITREMIRRIAAKPWFVPETTPMDSQLYAFRHRRKHFACVVDEYGAFLGIVTLEDIIEEIVGAIDDEHDTLGLYDIMPFGQNAYQMDGTVTIRDLNRQLGWRLPDQHATTIAGLILHEAEQIPQQGSVFEFYGIRFQVTERKANQLTRIVVEPLAAPAAEA